MSLPQVWIHRPDTIFGNVSNKLKEKGTTVLFTTHYIEEVNYCADRVLLLDNGNLMADETPYRLRMLNHEKLLFRYKFI